MRAAALATWMLCGAAACSRAEPEPSGVPPTASATATSEPVAGPMPTATTLGAVALPDTKRCVSECSERRKGEATSATEVEDACRQECKKECLEHCKQKRSGIPDFETICARDCGTQHELLR